MIICYSSMYMMLPYKYCQSLRRRALFSSPNEYGVVRDVPMYETDANTDDVVIRRIECEECSEVRACMYTLHPECDTLRWICPRCITELQPGCQ